MDFNGSLNNGTWAEILTLCREDIEIDSGRPSQRLEQFYKVDVRRYSMGDFAPPKRKDVFDRLRRRLELYRRHQSNTTNRYENAINTIYEQQCQETLIQRQRWLDSKAKKSSKAKPKDTSSSAGHGGERNLVVTVGPSQLCLPLGAYRKPLYCVDFVCDVVLFTFTSCSITRTERRMFTNITSSPKNRIAQSYLICSTRMG